MNPEALILTLMQRIRTIETSTPTSVDITAIGIALVLTELVNLRTEIRQDLAALGDELAGLRRHMHEHLTALRREMPHRPGMLPPLDDHLTTREPTHN